jgi:hypothetical protein
MYFSLPLRSVLAALVLFGTTLSTAAQESFSCEVTAVQAVGDKGEVVSHTDHLRNQVGTKFSVHKKTGAIRGGYFITNEHSQTTVVTNEPTSNTFYVTTTSYGPIRMVGYLYIGNHRTSATKPFLYTSSGEYIYVGFCQ